MTSSTALANRPGGLQKMDKALDYILMDASGSMSSKWRDMTRAVNAYADTLRWDAVNTHFMIQVFDTTYPDWLQIDADLPQVPDLTNEYSLSPSFGGTPLYDAINLMCCRLRDLDPPKCSIIIATDGEEADSQSTSLVQAKALLDWCRAKGWQVTFIGCDFNNMEQAGELGANEHTAIGVAKANLEPAMKALADKRKRYGLYGESMHYSDEEKQQFGGYLNAPPQNKDDDYDSPKYDSPK